MTFEIEDFLYPLSPLTVTLAFVLGMVLSFVLDRMHHRVDVTEAIFLLAMGTMFFVPLSVNRGLEQSPYWERFLANLVLWFVYVGGMLAMGWFRRRLTR